MILSLLETYSLHFTNSRADRAIALVSFLARNMTIYWTWQFSWHNFNFCRNKWNITSYWPLVYQSIGLPGMFLVTFITHVNFHCGFPSSTKTCSLLVSVSPSTGLMKVYKTSPSFILPIRHWYAGGTGTRQDFVPYGGSVCSTTNSIVVSSLDWHLWDFMLSGPLLRWDNKEVWGIRQSLWFSELSNLRSKAAQNTISS